MFTADYPIRHLKDDDLGRKPFAMALGNAIVDFSFSESLVIGLYGAWGSGKTSVINMALEHIAQRCDGQHEIVQPIIVHFNPWNFSDQNSLVQQFFRELSNRLKRQDHAKNAIAAGEQLETYAKFFRAIALVPAAGPLADALGKTLEYVGDAAQSWGELKDVDLVATKESLCSLLGKQPHRIIIVMDDIDRLNKDEIRQIFQLVKSLADFPNTIYLLSCDYERVVNVLSADDDEFGRNFLKKIIQVPFTLPEAPSEKIQNHLLEQLNELVKDLPEDRVDHTRWGLIYHRGLKHFFVTMRDVCRFLNTFRFTFSLTKDELNVVDSAALTAIQVFYPAVHNRIANNKDLFAGIMRDAAYVSQEREREEKRGRLDEILNSLEGESRGHVERVLEQLFPKFEQLKDGVWFGGTNAAKWRKEARVCCPEYFDVYFRLSLPEDELSRNEVERVLELASDKHEFEKAVKDLIDRELIKSFVDRLEGYTSDIPKNSIQNVVAAFMNLGDSLLGETESSFGFTTSQTLQLIGFQLLWRIASQHERFKMLKDAIDIATESLFTLVSYVIHCSGSDGKFGGNNDQAAASRVVNPAELAELEQAVCKKIHKWGQDGRLEDHPKLLSILYCWARWEKEHVRKFAENMLVSDDNLVLLISAFVAKNTSESLNDGKVTIQKKFDLTFLRELIDVEEVVARARDVLDGNTEMKLVEAQRADIQLFLDTVDGKIPEEDE